MRQTRKKATKQGKQIKTSKTPSKILINNSIRLETIANLNADQIAQLTRIYNEYGSRTDMTEKEIKQFVMDEKNQNTKPDIQRTYYSYCIMYPMGASLDANAGNIIVGYIIGKKTQLLLPKYLGRNVKPNKFDLVFSIGLDSRYKNKGIGTRAIELFINMYARKINRFGSYARNAKLYADIASTNIASMRAFEKNQFHYSHDIKISGKPYKRYARNVFS
jgi:GNAT superfamily N-acetyltransferase